ALRADLTAAIRDLYSKRERGTIPTFDRLIIETTGFADPAPIIFTLMAEPVLRHHFRVGHVVTTVDAVNGTRHLAQHPESVKQVAVADRVVLTKTDLAGRAQAEALRTACRRLNPAAPIFEPAVHPDRKSTRLNSSHQIISYAVFCLKKKNDKTDIHM